MIYLFIYFNWFMVHLFLSKQFSGLLVWNIYILELSQRREVEMRFKCFEWSACKLFCSKHGHWCRGGGAVRSGVIIVLIIQNSVIGLDALCVETHYQWVHIAVPIVPPVTSQGVLHNILGSTKCNHDHDVRLQSSPHWAASSSPGTATTPRWWSWSGPRWCSPPGACTAHSRASHGDSRRFLTVLWKASQHRQTCDEDGSHYS